MDTVQAEGLQVANDVDLDESIIITSDESLEGLEQQCIAFEQYLANKVPNACHSELAHPYIVESVWPVESGDVGISDAMVWQPDDGIIVVIPAHAVKWEDERVAIIWNGVNVVEKRLKGTWTEGPVCVRVPSEKVPAGIHELRYVLTGPLSVRQSLPLTTVVRFGQPGVAALDEAVELPEPVVHVPASGVVDGTQANASISVTIPAYPNMHVHDCIHVFWGAQTIRQTVASDAIGKAIVLDVPHDIVRAAGDSDQLPVYYYVSDEVGNESEWSQDTFVNVALSNTTLPAPVLVDSSEDVERELDYLLDLTELGGNDLTLNVVTANGLNINDSVRLEWSGTTVEGHTVTHTSLAQEVKSDDVALSFVVANAELSNLIDGSAEMHYVATRGAETLISKRSFFSITGANPPGLPAPSVSDAPDDWIEAERDPVFVIIPESAGLQAGDQVSVVWRGTAADGSVLLRQPKTYNVSMNYQGKPLPMRLEGPDVLAPLDGGWVDITYTVTRTSASLQRPDALVCPGAPVGSLILGISSDGKRAPSTERVVTPPVYDLPMTDEGEVYFFINEGVTPFEHNAGTLQVNLGVTRRSQRLDALTPKALQEALKGHLNEVSTGDYVKLYDTPAIWGQPFGKAAMVQAEKRAGEFEAAITDMLHKMRYRCDIASLNAPDAAWCEILLDAIDKALTTRVGRSGKTQIRFMLAQTPTVLLEGIPYYFTGTPKYLALKAALAVLIERRSAKWECVPDVWIGRYFRIAEPMKIALAHKTGCEALVAAFDSKMTWNHTKIVAVDGVESFVGGHNLNMDLFRSYPPVHDVSVKVLGKAALASQQFLNELWVADSGLLTKEYYDPVAKVWVNADDDSARPVDPLVEQRAVQYREAQYATNKKTPPQEPGFERSASILSVGKYWSGPDRQAGYKNGSEIMKEYVIKNAKTLLRLSQQDVFSAWKRNWRDHPVCRWIIEALLANPELKVQIVVSPLNAGAGAEGDQYSFGSGARRTFELFKYYLTHDEFTDKPIDDSSGLRAAALKRIEVAPFFFTDVPADHAIEGATYSWPDQSLEAHTKTLREPPLSARPPLAGVISHPIDALIKGAGLLGKVPSAPANHAKVTIIDDELYVVGSDNLYPGYLAEFNYVVAGPEAVKAFIHAYWDPLWLYSSKHAFSYRNT